MKDEECTTGADAATSPLKAQPPASSKPGPPTGSVLAHLRRWSDWVESLAGFEARGIHRVTAAERNPASLSGDIQVFLLWLSANLSLNNLGAGLLGPMLFGLGFKDAAICAVLGAFVGSLSTAYMCTWGPRSGNRTMVRTIAIRWLKGGGACKLGERVDANGDQLLGSVAFFHGILAGKNSVPSQYYSHDWLLYHRCHHRRTSVVCREWWRHEHRSRCRGYKCYLLGNCHIRHVSFSGV